MAAWVQALLEKEQMERQTVVAHKVTSAVMAEFGSRYAAMDVRAWNAVVWAYLQPRAKQYNIVFDVDAVPLAAE